MLTRSFVDFRLFDALSDEKTKFTTEDEEKKTDQRMQITTTRVAKRKNGQIFLKFRDFFVLETTFWVLWVRTADGMFIFLTSNIENDCLTV